MKRQVGTVVGATVLAVVLGLGSAWAETKVTVTREESKPKTVHQGG